MMNNLWRSELVQLLPIAAMIALVAACWPSIPERIPVHWNIHGEADGFGGRFVGLLSLPLAALGTYLLTLVLPRFDPGRANYPSFAGAYCAIRLAITLFFAAFEIVVVLVALGYAVNINAAIGLALGVMFIVFGSVMGKIRPNWFVGVRTPWTLSSELSWTKTHRLASWLFVAMGLMAVAWGLTPSTWMFGLMLAFDAACVVWIFVYSYLVYRTDPARISPSGTSATSE